MLCLCRAGEVQGFKRVDGPSEEEVQKKQEEGRKNSPFSNPEREFLLSLSPRTGQVLDDEPESPLPVSMPHELPLLSRCIIARDSGSGSGPLRWH